MGKYVIEVGTPRGVVRSMPIDKAEKDRFLDGIRDREEWVSFPVYENKDAFFPVAIIAQSIVTVEELVKS